MKATRELPNELLLSEISRLLANGSSVVLKARGNSMLPFVRSDVDSLELKHHNDVTVGDIVLARLKNGNYVAHRVVHVEGDRITLKGDGNLSGVERCMKADICGTAERIIKPRRRRCTGSDAGCRYVDCGAPYFAHVSRVWRNSPYIVRRIVLGVARRVLGRYKSN